MDNRLKLNPESKTTRLADHAEGAVTREEAEAAVRVLLRWSGENPEREGLRDTPARVARSYKELFAGYEKDAGRELQRTFTDVGGYSDLVLVKAIPLYSHCEHHLVPIIGWAHVAYRPNDRVFGLSKIARVIEIYARRLQTQETMTAQIARAIADYLNPQGVAVLIEAEHLCMSMCGIQKQGALTTTMALEGCFAGNAAEQARFMTFVRQN
ncbi:GTP cyclohydrolase I FolE [Rhizobium mayense]|uniref:GTP cyclohydrolase 1 n=1 Tax=Rhizobium mayense TaxID=1312184 RepID=A0ABT7K486_9HYPH|nr:GTP cyclohydrolase I FolE [Rhizobium mayense]MDL2403431.1 GTP cyclohydrolase I FolE [Rhizobium mayense]